MSNKNFLCNFRIVSYIIVNFDILKKDIVWKYLNGMVKFIAAFLVRIVAHFNELFCFAFEARFK